MTPYARFRLAILLFLVLLVVGIAFGITVSAQQANLNEAIKAVVRIRGCNSAGCNVDLGSGVIIESSGVILTANHVTLTDLNNPLSPHLEDFVIEVTENARLAPQARYRARLIASKPESDLALLGIYWDEAANQPLNDPSAVHLPALALADFNTITLGEQLHILGYPLAGGLTVNYTAAALGGFDENGALLKVQVPLSEGNSGGPALVERNGHYEIAGLVIRGRGSRNEVGLIRSIDQLHSLIWEPTARRVWLDHVQVTTQGSGADATVKVSADIHALDYANHDGRLLAYVFDANTRQPWAAGDSGVDYSDNGQLVLRQVFSATQMVDVLPQQTLMLSLKQLNMQADRLVFRLLLWDMNEAHVLWRDDQWWRSQQGATAVALASTQTPTFIPTVTSAPTNTPTITATEMPLPTNTSTASATDTSLPTSTSAPSATSTPIEQSTPMPDLIATSAMATMEAALSATPVEQLCTVASSSLNLRAGPGTNYQIIGALAKSTELRMQSRNQAGTWIEVQVKSDSKVGWVNAASQYINCNVDINRLEVVITPMPAPTVDMTATSAAAAISAALAQTPNAAASAVAPNLDPANVRINPVDGAVYVRVPSGEFIMGSDNGNSNEKPVHKVYLDEFWIMRTEVTNAQYKKCVEATVCVKPDNDSWDKPEQANYPVTHVNWQQASTYAQWVGGRLPTEAEWEKAACGTDGRIYPWGNDEPTEQLLNYNVGHTTEVGTYPKGASPYGALDMLGNVWEWPADWYAADYSAAPMQNPQGPATGEYHYRVLRGGSFGESRLNVRCASRSGSNPDVRVDFVGFRVASPGG